MKLRTLLLPLVAACLLPRALPAQEAACTCPTPGMLAVVFGWDSEDEPRAVVRDLGRGGPADRAGLRTGDVVVRIDGVPATRSSVEAATRQMRTGDTIRVRLLRDGAEREVAVVAGARLTSTPLSGRPLIAYGQDVQVYGVAPGESRVIRFQVDSLATRIDSLNSVARTLVASLDTTRLQEAERVLRQMQVRLSEGQGFDEATTIYRDTVVVVREGVPIYRGGVAVRGEALPTFLDVGARSVAGAEMAELNEGLSPYFDVGEGLLVLRVAPETPAARAGLQAGDVIVGVAGTAVRNQRELRTTLSAAEQGNVPMEIVRRGERRQMELEWRPRVYHLRTTPTRTQEITVQRNDNR